jgi:hypothetical protein
MYPLASDKEAERVGAWCWVHRQHGGSALHCIGIQLMARHAGHSLVIPCAHLVMLEAGRVLAPMGLLLQELECTQVVCSLHVGNMCGHLLYKTT